MKYRYCVFELLMGNCCINMKNEPGFTFNEHRKLPLVMSLTMGVETK